jgi:RNA polymerase sigma-70 factor (ECF subfamily)
MLHARQLFASHHGWLVARLQVRLRCTADAQDVASETFLRVLASRHLGAVQEPRAFLTTIAKRLLFTLWRRRALEQAYLETLALHPEEFAPSPEDRAVLLETLDYIVLSQIHGLGYHAIAGQLCISDSTVRRHMAEGFRRIAIALAQQEAGVAAPARRT